MIVFLNGKFLKKNQAKVSVFDHGFLYGDGIYETIRTKDGELWQIEKHLVRLRKSAKAIILKIPWSDKELNFWIKETVRRNKFKESRIRITLTRGVNDFVFSTTIKPTICITTQKLVQEKQVQKGVEVITYSGERILPTIKSIDLLPVILARQKMEQKKVYEALLVDRNGFIKEGTVTNFYLVKNGVLITPKEGILEGTTRDLILKLAKKLGKIELRPVKKEEIYLADECFLSNAPRGIIPVVKVDGRKIGNGKVGEYTREIRV